MDTKGPEVRTTAIAGGEPIPYQIGDKVKIVEMCIRDRFTTAASRAFCLGSMKPSTPCSRALIAMDRAPLTG